MVQAISTITIRIPKSKGKIDNKVVSKRRYVFYFVNTLMRNALEPTPINEINALSERVTDLVLRKAGKMEIVKVTVSPKYCGYVRIGNKTVGNYDFTLTIHVKDKVISVYEVRRNFDNRLFDVRFRVPRNGNDFADFVDIANYVSVINDYDFWDETFTGVVNYVVNSVKPRVKVNAYDINTNVTEFLAFLNEYVDIFNDKELRELVGKKYVYYWYRYLRNSGYFVVYHGDIE
jgi:hypothetical protein